MWAPILATNASPTGHRQPRGTGRDAYATTKAALDWEGVASLAKRQMRASVLARSQLTVGSMQKSSDNRTRFWIHEDGEVSRTV